MSTTLFATNRSQIKPHLKTSVSQLRHQRICIVVIIMNLLREYDFDCLPLLDREFDHPAVQNAVHALIAAEMRTFTPANYLSYLPYPTLSFANSSALQVLQ